MENALAFGSVVVCTMCFHRSKSAVVRYHHLSMLYVSSIMLRIHFHQDV